MPRKRFSVEQIINHLREAEVLLSQGQTVGEICRRIGVSEQSYYRWRREYGGLKIDQARRLKMLEQENARLKRAVADLTLDKLILKEAARGNFQAPSVAGDVCGMSGASSVSRSAGPAWCSISLVEPSVTEPWWLRTRRR
jgi:transposase-like protein